MAAWLPIISGVGSRMDLPSSNMTLRIHWVFCTACNAAMYSALLRSVKEFISRHSKLWTPLNYWLYLWSQYDCSDWMSFLLILKEIGLYVYIRTCTYACAWLIWYYKSCGSETAIQGESCHPGIHDGKACSIDCWCLWMWWNAKCRAYKLRWWASKFQNICGRQFQWQGE